ncbi:hypothetical protein [Bdellovibrio sp. HCB-110]|uniref:hypothetical protein n=1 Tax=Bdellovibrio sp. HCB-110 TaxID=3391182 RepID=UPI0039B37EB6
MKRLIVALMVAASASAQAMTDIQAVPLNLASEFKGEVVTFKSNLGVNAVGFGAVDISLVASDRNSDLEQYLIKGPMINNPYLKTFMSEAGARQRLFFGVEEDQNADAVAAGVADAVCKHMSPSKNFAVIDFKMTKVDVEKEAKSKAAFSGNTYWNNIFFTFEAKEALRQGHSAKMTFVEKTLELKLFKEIKSEAIFSLTHITCGRK